MQRRVAAIYFAFFLVLGASAYSVIAVAEEPAIEIGGENNTYSASDNVTVNGRTYEVADIQQIKKSGGGGHGGGGGAEKVMSGNLTYTNTSAVYRVELADGSVLSPVNSSWPGKAAEYTATLTDGDTVRFNGSQRTVNATGDGFALVNASGNETASFSVGDTFEYRSNATTVTAATDTSATLTWGANYAIRIANVSDPDEFTVVQEFNVTRRIRQDPEVENRTYTGEDNETFVRYRNGTTQPLDEYLPAPERATFAEGDTLTYRMADDVTVPANETTVANVTTERVLLEWEGTKTTRVRLSEGTNVTLGPPGQTTKYVVHFPDQASVTLSSDIEAYFNEVEEQEYYKERINGLWGVSILSAFAGIFIVGLAYLPHRG